MPRLVERGAPEVRFEVTWCSSIPKDECGDSDIDRAVHEVEYYKTFGLAVARAKRLLREGRDQFGSVEITEQRWAPHPDFPGRFWWSEWADLYVDEPGMSYCHADLRPIDDGYDD